MKTLYLECNMGAAGDMLMGALLELHPDKAGFVDRLNRIGIPEVSVKAEPSVKCGITGTHVSVRVNGLEEESVDVRHDHGHRHGAGHENSCIHDHNSGHDHSCNHDFDHDLDLDHSHIHDHAYGHPENSDIVRDPVPHHDDIPGHTHAGLNDIFRIVDSLDIPNPVKEDVKGIYRTIAEAESRVHGRPVAEVHFHEVGSADAIADITGCALLLSELGVDRVITSPVNVGFGQVRCAHGILPVPAPATALILEGIPCYAGSIEGELCTPTGAAIVKHFTSEFRKMPQMVIKKTGYGMGKKDFPAANCVRAVLGETMEEGGDEIVELRCNLDDMPPEDLGYAMEVFFAHGALDVFTVPVGMKKSRPGILLTIMCRQQDRDLMARLIFQHTSTIGIREYTCSRMVLSRSERTLDSRFGSVRVKVSDGYGVHKEKMEYEDLKKIAENTGMPLREVRAQF